MQQKYFNLHNNIVFIYSFNKNQLFIYSQNDMITINVAHWTFYEIKNIRFLQKNL